MCFRARTNLWTTTLLPVERNRSAELHLFDRGIDAAGRDREFLGQSVVPKLARCRMEVLSDGVPKTGVSRDPAIRLSEATAQGRFQEVGGSLGNYLCIIVEIF